MTIHIYYGERPAVLHGRLVSIQNCQHVESTVELPIDLKGLQTHVMSLLRLNQQSYNVILEGVRPRPVPNSSLIVHTLFDLRTNNAWALYSRKALEENFEIGVYVTIVSRPVHGEEVATVEGLDHNVMHDEAGGNVGEGTSGTDGPEVDHGEVDAQCMDDEAGGSGDEEGVDNDDPVPAIQYFHGAGLLNCTISEYNTLSNWGYHNSDIQVGQRFQNREEVIHFISNYAVITRRDHKCARSNHTEYEVRCTKHPTCPYFVRAHKPKHENYFVLSRHTPHTCSEEAIRNVSHAVDARFIAQLLITLVGINICLSPKSIMEEVQTKTGMLINYHTAWRAKQKALKMLFGSFEDSYHYAPRLMQKIAMTNPGTQWAMADEPIRLDDGSYSNTDRYLIRFFWSFGQCIEAFRHCKPVVCVDATFLSGKYHGNLMTAMAADANNQIIPLAYALVESENNDSWLWFLTLVRTRVVGNRERVCIISDRNKGLLHALDVLHASTNPSIAWPDVERRWCMRHLGANLYSRYHNKGLVKKFKGLCLQNQQAKFNEIWRELNETTRKMMAQQEAQEDHLRTQMVGGQTIISRSRGTFSQWIAGKPAERWALFYDTHGSR
ncbi:uncharacterized protein LOC133899268 [Phragmites australis]|uniref:uncharacterized protein LOC133899268 n=1 Tax=Phragmites australis TaxID=29695 RepID=UPI002D774E63|nr:uncharacterized protein LOC133899268 [Phragmites australis]